MSAPTRPSTTRPLVDSTRLLVGPWSRPAAVDVPSPEPPLPEPSGPTRQARKGAPPAKARMRARRGQIFQQLSRRCADRGHDEHTYRAPPPPRRCPHAERQRFPRRALIRSAAENRAPFRHPPRPPGRQSQRSQRRPGSTPTGVTPLGERASHCRREGSSSGRGAPRQKPRTTSRNALPRARARRPRVRAKHVRRRSNPMTRVSSRPGSALDDLSRRGSAVARFATRLRR